MNARTRKKKKNQLFRKIGTIMFSSLILFLCFSILTQDEEGYLCGTDFKNRECFCSSMGIRQCYLDTEVCNDTLIAEVILFLLKILFKQYNFLSILIHQYSSILSKAVLSS